MPAPAPTLVPLHVVPSPIEQEHIHQALDASNTAISAINTIAVVAGFAIAVVTLGVAVLAFLGYNAIKRAAAASAERIANERHQVYIDSPEFQDLVRVKIEKAIEAKWQSTLIVRLGEEPRPAGDPEPFPNANPTGEHA